MNNTELEKEIKRIVQQNCSTKGYVSTIDILLELKLLTKKDYENWRFGKIDYLEKACQINLSKLTTIRKITKLYSLKINLKASLTGYNQFGKGAKRRLRFSKSGVIIVEEQYATHYIDKDRINEIKNLKPGGNNLA